MRDFHFRGFISILLSLAFCIVVVTGLVLWLGHSPQTFGLGKGIWKHTHIFLSLLMLVTGVIHLYLNWAVYWSYLWNRTTHRLHQIRELVVSVLILALVLSTAAMDNHGGAALGAMSIQEVVRRSGKPLDQIVAALQREDIHIHNPADSLAEIAKHNNRPPEVVIAVIQREIPNAMRPGPHGH